MFVSLIILLFGLVFALALSLEGYLKVSDPIEIKVLNPLIKIVAEWQRTASKDALRRSLRTCSLFTSLNDNKVVEQASIWLTKADTPQEKFLAVMIKDVFSAEPRKRKRILTERILALKMMTK